MARRRPLLQPFHSNCGRGSKDLSTHMITKPIPVFDSIEDLSNFAQVTYGLRWVDAITPWLVRVDR